MGKITDINREANRKLVRIYVDKDIRSCELRFDGCTNNAFLGFAHRHKRIFYRDWPEGLADFNQTILACTNCHGQIEFDSELSEEMFNKLRGEEDEA